MAARDERDVNEEEFDDEQEEEEEREDGADAAAAEAAAAAAAAEEEAEEIQDEKPFAGQVRVPFGFGGIAHAEVRFADDVPQWLLYVVNDDAYWFDRCLQGKVASQPPAKAGGAVAGDDQGDDAAGEGEAEATPAGGNGADDDGGDAVLAVDVNALFVLVQDLSEATGGAAALSTSFVCKPYTPPPPEEDTEAEGDGGAAGEDAAAADGGADAGEAEGEDEEADQSAAAKAAAAAAAAADADEEAEPEPIEVIVDGVTLAALLSPTCLELALRRPNVHLRRWSAYCGQCFASGVRSALDAVIAARKAAAASAHPYPRQPVDLTWIIDAHNGVVAAAPAEANANAASAAAAAEKARAALVAAAGQYLEELIMADVVPSAPIAATSLRTSAAVNAYVWLLLHMPKSLLVAWSKPRADDDGNEPGDVPEDAAEEAALATNAPVARFLAVVLLDLRRRAARAAKGKPPLREPLEVAHARAVKILTVLGGGDKGADAVAAPQFAARPYHPQTLQLRMSDLAVAAVGRFDFAEPSFRALLQLRMAVPRERSAPFGLPALLFDSIATVLAPSATRALIELGDPEWFRPAGLVHIAEWASSGLAARPDALSKADATLFAQRFGRYFLANEKYLHATEDSSRALYDRLREVERFVELGTRECSKGNDECDVNALETALERAGAGLVCTPDALYRAAANGNAKAVHWLVRRGVAHVALPGTAQTVGVLEFAVEHLRNAQLAHFLVEEGADLGALWRGGRTSGVCAVQDCFAAEEAAAILETFRAKEAERLADPRCKVGLLHASAA